VCIASYILFHVESVVVFQHNLHLCKQSSSTFEQELVFTLCTSFCPFCASVAHGILQCLVIT